MNWTRLAEAIGIVAACAGMFWAIVKYDAALLTFYLLCIALSVVVIVGCVYQLLSL